MIFINFLLNIIYFSGAEDITKFIFKGFLFTFQKYISEIMLMCYIEIKFLLLYAMKHYVLKHKDLNIQYLASSDIPTKRVNTFQTNV